MIKEVALVVYPSDFGGIEIWFDNHVFWWLVSNIWKQRGDENLFEEIRKIASESKHISFFKEKARMFLHNFFDANRSHPLLLQCIKENEAHTREFQIFQYDDEIYECTIKKEYSQWYENDTERLIRTPIIKRNTLSSIMERGNIDELLAHLNERGLLRDFILRD